MKTFLERVERKQENGHQILDQYIISKLSAEKSAREAKSSKNLTWVSLVVAVVGTIATVIALFK
jgi:hypothetical protein